MPWTPPFAPAGGLCIWGRHGSCYFPRSPLWYLLCIAPVALRRKGHFRQTYRSCQGKRILVLQRVET